MNIDTSNLFPIGLAFPGLLLDGKNNYYLRSNLCVYSTKSGKLKRINGWRSAPSGNTFFRLEGNSYTLALLSAGCRAHPLWSKHTTQDVHTNYDNDNTTEDETSDMSIAQHIKNKSYVIGTVVKGQLVFGSLPKFHATLGLAQSEAMRIAKIATGTKVVILQVNSAVTSGAVVWE